MKDSLRLLIRLRKQLLDAQRRELGVILERMTLVEATIRRTTQSLQHELDEAGRVEVGYCWSEAYWKRMKHHTHLLSEQLKTLRQTAERQQALIAETYKESRQFELTLERVLEEERHQMLKREQKELDEIAIQRFSKT